MLLDVLAGDLDIERTKQVCLRALVDRNLRSSKRLINRVEGDRNRSGVRIELLPSANTLFRGYQPYTAFEQRYT
jgi:DNA-binding MarR family transcriptional regulator